MASEPIELRKEGKIITKRKPLSHDVKRSISLLLFTLLFIIIVLSIIFIMNGSQTYQKGNVLEQEKLKKEKLLMQNRDLIDQIIKSTAYKKINESKQVQSMQKPENPQYIEPEKNKP